MPIDLFDAFTGLFALLACGAVAALFLCTREVESNDARDWTLRPRRR